MSPRFFFQIHKSYQPINSLAPEDIKNAVIIRMNECFRPLFKDPSVNFPITNPTNNPCVNSKYKNGLLNSSGSSSCMVGTLVAISEEPPGKPTKLPSPAVKGSILNSITRIIPMKTKKIIYPCTTKL